jgi:hypothetical protein
VGSLILGLFFSLFIGGGVFAFVYAAANELVNVVYWLVRELSSS